MSPARRKKPAVVEERDEEHPRETYALIGHEAALARAAHAIRTGHPPQAWLISGPPGVGKATFAYRIARYLLRYGATAEGPADLSLPEDDAVSRRVAAQAHAGLLELRRRLNDKGKLQSELPVDEVRKLTAFFGYSSGEGGWRIAIVDTADEMNENAANALLKNLEEPPARSLLLLLSNAPGRLLPTIRSRTQRLDLRPLDPALLAAQLTKRFPEADATDRAALARLSGGSLGLALKLADEGGLDFARQADALIDAPRPDPPALLAFGDRMWRHADALGEFGGFLLQALAARIRARALAGEERIAGAWLAAYEQIAALYERAVEVNMEPKQTILASAEIVADTKRRAGAI